MILGSIHKVYQSLAHAQFGAVIVVFNGYEKSCTLVSNSQGCVHLLDSVCRKAWNMFSARAYVYQYMENGLSHEDFLESFACVEQLLKNYASIQN